MPPPSRARATLFDKLVANAEISGLRADGGVDDPGKEVSRENLRFYTVSSLERFNESALRATVKRELAWILNTVNMESAQNLDAYPHVKTSVLNYGVAELSGKSMTPAAVRRWAQALRTAVLNFEPRFDPKTLEVEPQKSGKQDDTVTFVLRGDVTAAVNAMPVQFNTDVEMDTGAATVRD
jgi:type VI secretion system protein ImpF